MVAFTISHTADTDADRVNADSRPLRLIDTDADIDTVTDTDTAYTMLRIKGNINIPTISGSQADSVRLQSLLQAVIPRQSLQASYCVSQGKYPGNNVIPRQSLQASYCVSQGKNPGNNGPLFLNVFKKLILESNSYLQFLNFYAK